ncbi:MAG: hypothetical protein ACREBR_00765, partial [bacterium]
PSDVLPFKENTSSHDLDEIRSLIPPEFHETLLLQKLRPPSPVGHSYRYEQPLHVRGIHHLKGFKSRRKKRLAILRGNIGSVQDCSNCGDNGETNENNRHDIDSTATSEQDSSSNSSNKEITPKNNKLETEENKASDSSSQNADLNERTMPMDNTLNLSPDSEMETIGDSTSSSSNSEPSNSEPSSIEPRNSEPSNSEPSNSEPSNSEPRNSEPSYSTTVNKYKTAPSKRAPSPASSKLVMTKLSSLSTAINKQPTVTHHDSEPFPSSKLVTWGSAPGKDPQASGFFILGTSPESHTTNSPSRGGGRGGVRTKNTSDDLNGMAFTLEKVGGNKHGAVRRYKTKETCDNNPTSNNTIKPKTKDNEPNKTNDDEMTRVIEFQKRPPGEAWITVDKKKKEKKIRDRSNSSESKGSKAHQVK